MSGAHSQHPSQSPPGDGARKPRRALADGPAVRAALAAAGSKPASAQGGWKLLDGPPAASGTSKSSAIDHTQSPRPAPTPAVGVPRPASSQSLRRVTPPKIAAVAAPIASPPTSEPRPAGPRRATPPPAPKRALTPPHLPAVKAPEPEAAVAAPEPEAAVAAPELPAPELIPVAASESAAASIQLPPPPRLPEIALAAAAEVVPATPIVAAEPQPMPPVALPLAPSTLATPPEPATTADENFSYAAPAPRNRPTKWLIASAAVCLVSGVGLGLLLMRAIDAKTAPPAVAVAVSKAPINEANSQASAPAAPSPSPGASPTAPAPAAPAVVAPTPQPTATVAVAGSSSAIPWDDLPPATAKTCEELAQVGSGPKSFMLQQSVTSAQRALMRGDTAAAHAAFCTAAQLGVPSDTVLLGLSQVLLMQSDPSAALKTIDQLLDRAPNNKAALDWRGDILVRMGRVEEAKQAWFKAAGASRASKPLIDNLVRASDADIKLALRSGDLSRADRMLRRVIALTSGDPEHCRQLVAVLTKSGNAAAEQRWRTYLSTLSG